MTIASLILGSIGAFVVLAATVQQSRLDPDDPKYNVGSGIAVSPPPGQLFGAPAGMQVLSVSVPGARQLVLDQGRLTQVTAAGAALQFLAVILAIVAR